MNQRIVTFCVFQLNLEVVKQSVQSLMGHNQINMDELISLTGRDWSIYLKLVTGICLYQFVPECFDVIHQT